MITNKEGLILKLEVKEMVQCALFTCIIAICAQISIQLPTRVPMTLQTLAIYFIALACNRRVAVISTLLYVLMGAVGLGVFSGFSGGLGAIVGPSGGFIISFPIIAFVISTIASKKESVVRWAIALYIGSALCYGIGTAYFIFVTKASLMTALSACVLPFLPGDTAKIIASVTLAKKLKRFVIQNKNVALNNAN